MQFGPLRQHEAAAPADVVPEGADGPAPLEAAMRAWLERAALACVVRHRLVPCPAAFGLAPSAAREVWAGGSAS